MCAYKFVYYVCIYSLQLLGFGWPYINFGALLGPLHPPTGRPKNVLPHTPSLWINNWLELHTERPTLSCDKSFPLQCGSEIRMPENRTRGHSNVECSEHRIRLLRDMQPLFGFRMVKCKFSSVFRCHLKTEHYETGLLSTI